MRISSTAKVLSLYEESADSYNKMMDTEISLPVYSDTLSRLARRIASIKGPLLDTACGSGHMLRLYQQKYEPNRPLIAIDISVKMTEITRHKLGDHATTYVADMRNLSMIQSHHCAAVINYFTIHHLTPDEICKALNEWYRVLCINGQFILGAWEGDGYIDYGEESDVVASKYSQNDIKNWVSDCGFTIDRIDVEFIEDMDMNAAYLEATKK